jgi:hypothetical protein
MVMSLWWCLALMCVLNWISIEGNVSTGWWGHIGSNTIVIPVNVLGFANRLRIIASAYSIAVKTLKRLVVVWQPNEDCMALLSDLYSLGEEVQFVMVEGPSDNRAFVQYVRTSIHSIASEKGLSVKERYLQNFLYQQDAADDVVILWTRGTHAHNNDCVGYLSDKAYLYQLLQPTAAVASLVNSASINLETGLLVGVHVRAFDERYDWPVVSPSLDQNTVDISGATGPQPAVYNLQSKRFDQAASLDVFVTIMNDLIVLHPSVRFFLASNSAEAKQRIVQHFGADRILTLDQNTRLGERESVHSIVTAAAEFHLLGMTDVVVHTRGSSFAREAAARTGIPVIDVGTPL